MDLIFEGYDIEVYFDYEPGEPRTFDDEGSDEELCINTVCCQGVEITGLMGEDMLDKLTAHLLKIRGEE